MTLSTPRPVHDRPLTLIDLPMPEPGEDEILVKVHVCGVCRTDLHQVEGELPMHRTPVVPGHQVVGTVEKLGPGASRFKLGDRVGMAWLHHTCRDCAYCHRGVENLCPTATFTGYDAHGGYAEYTKVHEDFAYRLPDGFDDLAAAPLLCAGIIGYRTLRLSGIKPGGRLGIYGFGAAAHIAIQVARHWGCEVYVFTRGKSRQQLGLDMGAVWAGTSTDAPPNKLDAAVVFAPAGPLVPDALGVLAPGGAVALGGIYMSEIPPMDYTRHLYHERVLRSVMNATRRDGEELLELAVTIPIKTKTTVFPLEETNDALIALMDGRIEGAAVIAVT
ncbi:MAG: zinc-dependent alcohol dehydrogenase family protein [Phycisphaerales bacterium]|nr:zinc-dependent alcohol dehydrogenase family protein [Phycisphaerales bacterium]